MSTEEKASIAFEVEFKKNPNAPIPDHIKSKLVEEAGKNLNEDELRAKIQAKLDAAEERKKKMEEEKAAKAAQEVAHAKQKILTNGFHEHVIRYTIL
ncbi:hypothetical protein GLOIN_2v1846543 [Rhizophagus irregularis DAOM 181602=DAOM 197198]|nr:hypothetical protein GLOIN_2v1846543 [Rhizophagus irregularis DAOM 181602=DAOM 197198]